MHPEEFKHKALAWQASLYRMALSLLRNRQEAEDAVQETFLKLWKHHTRLMAADSPKAFALRTVRNLCLDRLKSRTRQPYTNELEGISVADPTAHRHAEAQDTIRNIHALIDRLPEQQRTVFQLRAIEDLSTEEIEDVTGFTAEYIRVILSRARKALREMYEKQHQNGPTRPNPAD